MVFCGFLDWERFPLVNGRACMERMGSHDVDPVAVEGAGDARFCWQAWLVRARDFGPAQLFTPPLLR